jgi:hypothetical protein
MPTPHALKNGFAGPSRIITQIGLLLLAISTAACGSSGDGGDPSGGTAGTSARLEFFQASLDAIDPADPSTVISIDPNVADFDNFPDALPSFAGTIAANTISDLQVEWVFYARDDGTFQRVSTETGNGTPTPVRVSSEDMPFPVCETAFGLDLTESTNARVAYGKTTALDCLGELTWQLVTLSDDATTDPRDFPGTPLEALSDPTTGAHTGWLTVDDGSLHRLAPDLSVQSANLLTGIQTINVLGSTGNPFIFLEVGQSLYAFNPATDELIDFEFDFAGQCPCFPVFATGINFAFFADARELFRADPVAGTVARIDAPEDAISLLFEGFSFVKIGTDRVAWSYVSDADGSLLTPDDQSTIIRSVEKDGSNPIELETFPTPLAASDLINGIVQPFAGDWLFYQTFLSPNPLEDPQAVAVRLDGSQRREYPGGVWIGTTLSDEFSNNQLGALARILRLDGVTNLADPSNDSLSLASVSATDPASGEIALGNLPSGAQSVSSLSGFGPARLGSLISLNGSDVEFDMLFWDEEIPNSLQQITNTNGVRERLISLF